MGRMENKKEMTTPNVSVATDTEQSLSKRTDNSITDKTVNFSTFSEKGGGYNG